MEQLMEILHDLHPDMDLTQETGLVDSGILDSMDIVELITEIEDVYEVQIKAKDLVPDNFNSAQAIYALIQRMRDED